MDTASVHGSSQEAAAAVMSSGASSLSNGISSNMYWISYAPKLREGLKELAPASMKRKRRVRSERKRRMHMNTLLDSLRVLLPNRTPRKDRCSLLTDTMSYLQTLEETIQKLDVCKKEIIASYQQAKLATKPSVVATRPTPFEPNAFKNFHVQVCEPCKSETKNKEVIVTFTSPQIKGLFSQVLLLFNASPIEVISATCSSTLDGDMLLYIHAEVPKHLQFHIEDVIAVLHSI